MFRALPETAESRVLLCTELHGGNILAAQRAPWLVIDPKPYLGDPAYDVLQRMLNREDRLAAELAGLPKRMADLAGVDADRVRQWLFARSARLGISHARRDGRRDFCRQSRRREMDGVGKSPTAASSPPGRPGQLRWRSSRTE